METDSPDSEPTATDATVDVTVAALPPTTGRGRIRTLHSLFLLGGLILIARLVHIHVLCQDQFASQATRQQISIESVPARHGDILDRQGRLLATTVSVASVYVNPRAISDPQATAAQLADVLGLKAPELTRRIQQHADKQFLWVKRHISDEEQEAFEKLKLPAASAGLRAEFERNYPQGTLAAHVIGLRDIDGLGHGGAEEAFDVILRGEPGRRQFVRDARGNVLDVLEEVTLPPREGSTVVLTIDALLQLHVERELDRLMAQHQPVGACAIVLSPVTGDVLAMASRPTFDPQHPESAPAGGWKNLALSAVFEPGSTIKPCIVAGAMDRGMVKADEVFDCEWGAYRMGRRTLHDHHSYGELSLTDVLVKSSNIGMAKIGERLGNAELYRVVTLFGFGQKTGIELPGELTGLLRPLDRWNSYSTGSIPMGQELAATPLQVLAAHAVLANHGVRITPHILLTTDASGGGSRPRVVAPVIQSDVADWLVTGPLVEVIKRGTGKQAQLPGVAVFGKTGTAQKMAKEGAGYSSSRHISSFVCGAPAESPRLMVLVSVDEPRGSDQYGGTVAAPVAAAILQKGLLLFPDPEQLTSHADDAVNVADEPHQMR